MPYEVLLLPRATRDLRKLPADVPPRVTEALQSLEEPRRTGIKKLQGGADSWRPPVGDYRIIYGIDDAERQVIVSGIAHRRDAYRGL